MIKIKKQFKNFSFPFMVTASLTSGLLFGIFLLPTSAQSAENIAYFQSTPSENSFTTTDSFFQNIRLRAFGDYNMTRNTQREGFKAYLKGTGADITAQLTDSFSAGIGYGYSTTDLKKDGAKNRIDGDTYFIFGKYQPEKWYISANLTYNHSRYKDKNPDINQASADIYRGALFSGYEMGNVHNYSGLKYTYLHGKDKNNAAFGTPLQNGEVITAVIGTSYKCLYHPTENLSLTPLFWLSGQYDLKSNSRQSVIDVPDSAFIYAFEGRRLHRLGLETGIRLGMAYKQAELSVGYGLNWRVSHTSQTGKLNLAWHF